MDVISVAKVDDAEAILGLQKRAYESEARLYNDWSILPLTQSVESLVAEIATGGVWKCCREGAIVGSVRGVLRDGTCEIGRLIVEPALQRQGIGSRLLRAIEAAFPQAGRFELFTGTQSVGNLRLYRRHGYEVIATKVLSPAVTLAILSKPRKTSESPSRER